MKFTVTGALGNINQSLINILVKAGHEVTVISSNPERKAAIEALGAKAAIGSVTDVTFLTQAFSGADAVYTMVPPKLEGEYRSYMAGVGRNFAAAIKAAGIKRVVNLSSIGAHLPDGTGPIKGLYDVEHTLDALEGVAVKHLRAGFFYFNFFGNIDMIKHAHIMGNNYDINSRLALTHPRDIAETAAEALQGNFSGKSYEYVVSDERPVTDIVKVLGAAVGQPELPWIKFSNEQAFEGMTKAGIPEIMAGAYVEMGVGVDQATLWEDYDRQKPAKYGKTKLEDFAKEFVQVYNN